MVSKSLQRATYFAALTLTGLFAASSVSYNSYRNRTTGSIRQTSHTRWGYKYEFQIKSRDGIRVMKMYTSMEPESYHLYYPEGYYPNEPKKGLRKEIKDFSFTREPVECVDVTNGDGKVERLYIDNSQ